jgi:probable phosphoglycerate mutase
MIKTDSADDPVAQATLWGRDHLELVFVRHGQPMPFADRPKDEFLDPRLSPAGIAQAKATASALAHETVDAVYSSDMARARMTADLLAAPFDLAVHIVSELREVGVHDRSTHPEAKTAEQWADIGRDFVASGRWEVFPMSESGVVFRSRVVQAIDSIIEQHAADTRVVIASHSGVINVYAAHVLKVTKDYFFRPAHGSVTRFWSAGATRVLWSVNEHRHLARDLFTG